MMRVLHADCLDAMRQLASDGVRVHSVVTDPPYHLTSIVKRFGSESAAPVKDGIYARSSAGFMGKQWDGGDIAFRPETWRLCFDLLPPGGHLVAFGGTRTHHRIWCAIEDAGFEVRDTLAWLYGSGFPKSHDVSKGIDKAAGAARTKVVGVRPGHEDFAERTDAHSAGARREGWDRPWKDDPEAVRLHHLQTAPATIEAEQWQGWGTALKPAFEPIILARKPLAGTVAATVLAHGTGAINVDGCRVGADGGTRGCDAGPSKGILGNGLNGSFGVPVPGLGRWPANVVHDGSDEVIEAFPQAPGQQAAVTGDEPTANGFSGVVYGSGGKAQRAVSEPRRDSGSASRFFKSAHWTEDDLWTSDLVNFAADCSSLQSAAVVSALGNAVAWSMPGSALIRPSYRAPSISATASELRLLGELVTATIQSIERRCSHGLPPASITTTIGPAKCAATPGPTGTMTITTEHWMSDGSADPVTFSITLPSAGRGAADSAPRLHYSAKADAADRCGSKHPTVKPVDLMAWLVRLVTPPGGTVLDPFAGSGTTGMACIREGFDAILIEREAEYVADIRRRLAHVDGTDTPLFKDTAA